MNQTTLLNGLGLIIHWTFIHGRLIFSNDLDAIRREVLAFGDTLEGRLLLSISGYALDEWEICSGIFRDLDHFRGVVDPHEQHMEYTP